MDAAIRRSSAWYECTPCSGKIFDRALRFFAYVAHADAASVLTVHIPSKELSASAVAALLKAK